MSQANPGRFSGQLECLVHILRTEGPRGLLRGSLLTLARDVPAFCAYFATYETLRSKLQEEDGTIGLGQTVGIGGLAGVVAWALALPLDSLKNRHQVRREKSFVQISTRAPGLPQADLPHPLAEWAEKAAWRLEAALPWSSCCSAQSLPCQCSHVHRVRSTWSTIAFYTSSFQIWVDNEGALVGLDPHSEGGRRVAQICAKTKWRPQLLVMTIRLCWHLEKSQRLYLVPDNWWRLNWLW